MSAMADLMADCDAQGIRLIAGEGDGLVVDAPQGALTSELVERIKALKSELLAILRPKADMPSIHATDTLSLWHAALDQMEGDPLFPADVMEGLRNADVHWVLNEATPDPIGDDGWPLDTVDPDDLEPCAECGSFELWQSVTGRWRCQNCDPPTATVQELKEKASRLRNGRVGLPKSSARGSP